MNRISCSSQRSEGVLRISVFFLIHIQPIPQILTYYPNLSCLDSFLNSIRSLLICLSTISLALYNIFLMLKSRVIKKKKLTNLLRKDLISSLPSWTFQCLTMKLWIKDKMHHINLDKWDENRETCKMLCIQVREWIMYLGEKWYLNSDFHTLSR